MMRHMFNSEEFCCFFNHRRTLLHDASGRRHIDVVKYLIEKGAVVNSIWDRYSMEIRMNVFALISNFNDPFYQRYWKEEEISKSQFSTLIENGMI